MPTPQPMRILKRETTTTGEDGSWQVVARSAEDHAPWARARIAAIVGTAQVELPEGSETLLFALASPTQTAFVIGAKGRNAGLVQRYAGLRVVIRADCDVLVTPARTKVDPLLARRIVLATSLGGVLRWFVTPKATIEGYPAASADALRAAAKEFACDLVTMRSHRGMCMSSFMFCVFNPKHTRRPRMPAAAAHPRGAPRRRPRGHRRRDPKVSRRPRRGGAREDLGDATGRWGIALARTWCCRASRARPRGE